MAVSSVSEVEVSIGCNRVQMSHLESSNVISIV